MLMNNLWQPKLTCFLCKRLPYSSRCVPCFWLRPLVLQDVWCMNQPELVQLKILLDACQTDFPVYGCMYATRRTFQLN
jgi:hypothetical protein